MHTAIHTHNKDATVKARVNSVIKHQAENVLKHLGVSMSETINALLVQIKLTKGVPFQIKIPNDETLQAMRETEEGMGLIESKDFDDLFDKLEMRDAKIKAQKRLSKGSQARRKKG
jgi:DNA-damage-inducible protein J